MDAPPESPPPATYKDRRTGLMIFGIVEIVLGALCALLIPLMILGQVMAAQTGAQPVDLKMILPGIIVYLVMSVVLISLGIGSIKVRRWARALMLILAWSALVTGLLTTAAMALVLPQIIEAGPGGNQLPKGAATVAMLIGLGFVGVIFVLIPAALVFFYQSKNVQATCEALDPKPRWTDACPLPVLAVSAWMAFGAAFLLLMPFCYNGAFPFFGMVLFGWPGTVLALVLVAVWIYAARSIYRLEMKGWWVVTIMFGLMLVSNVITFSRVGLMELYARMGYPEQTIQQLRQYDFMNGKSMMIWSIVVAIPILGYLVYIRRFFPKTPANLPGGS